jgi:hypothetical protein
MIKLSEILKSNSSLTVLDLGGNKVDSSVLLTQYTANKIGDEGAIKLFEVIKSNSSLNLLDLRCNITVATFDSHLIQLIILVTEELSNYLKR